MDYFIKKKGGKYPFSPCGLLPEMGGSGFKKIRKEEMVFEEGMILNVLLNMVVHPFSVHITVSCLPIKLFLYFLNLHYEFESIRGKAAPHQVS